MLIIIPARYASSRFPGKPLALINGHPIIEHVYDRAVEAAGPGNVIVATDDSRIFEAVKNFGGRPVMTSPDCSNGTERCREAYINSHSQERVVINVQGDEPMISPSQINALAQLLENPDVHIATLVRKADENDDIFDPGMVKVTRAFNGRALYFSRSPIPYVRDVAKSQWTEHAPYFIHLGMYGFQASVLQRITQLPQSPLEKAEKLEQLRWLENGFTIATAVTNHRTVGIDTPADLEMARKAMQG